MTPTHSTPTAAHPHPDDGAEPDVRWRILNAAVQVFAERGFDGASVRDLTERAGVNIAAINYYFGGKEALYLRAVEAAYHECGLEPQAMDLPAELPARERLRRMIGMLVTNHLQQPNPAAMSLMIREMLQPTTPTCNEWVERMIRPIAHRLFAILRELMPEVDANTCWRTGFSIVAQSLFYRQNRRIVDLLTGVKQAKSICAPEAICAHIEAFTFAALGLGPPVGQASSGEPADSARPVDLVGPASQPTTQTDTASGDSKPKPRRKRQ